MPKPVLTPVTDSAELARQCEHLAKAEFVTVDTEFARTSTYYAQLCVVQLADNESAIAVDALAPGIDLTPLYDLLVNPDVLKVFHAARQDLEIFYHAIGKIPAPIFDTQIAAMVCGFGDSVGYETLVKTLTNGSLDKAIRFTDWSRRPLSEKQITYALGDVIYLREIYRTLKAKVDETGRTAWLEEEITTQDAPETYDADPMEVWHKLKTRSSNRRFLARVREMAAWREITARARDIPKNRVIRDEVLMEIAAHPPKHVDQLRKIKALPKRYGNEQEAGLILAALKRADEVPEDQLPEAKERRQKTDRAGPVLELLKVLLKYRCQDAEVAAKLVLSSDELERFALGQRKNIRFLNGWRQEVFGSDALALVEGKLGLSANGDRIDIKRVEE